MEEIGDRLEFDEELLERSVGVISRVISEQGPFDGMVRDELWDDTYRPPSHIPLCVPV